MKVLLLLVAGTKRQHEAALPSINSAKNNIEFDLLYITRNFSYFPRIIPCKKIKNIFLKIKYLQVSFLINIYIQIITMKFLIKLSEHINIIQLNTIKNMM